MTPWVIISALWTTHEMRTFFSIGRLWGGLSEREESDEMLMDDSVIPD